MFSELTVLSDVEATNCTESTFYLSMLSSPAQLLVNSFWIIQNVLCRYWQKPLLHTTEVLTTSWAPRCRQQQELLQKQSFIHQIKCGILGFFVKIKTQLSLGCEIFLYSCLDQNIYKSGWLKDARGCDRTVSMCLDSCSSPNSIAPCFKDHIKTWKNMRKEKEDGKNDVYFGACSSAPWRFDIFCSSSSISIFHFPRTSCLFVRPKRYYLM